MKDILLVDFSWLFVRLFYVNNTNREHIQGTIRYISMLANIFDKAYVILDGKNGSVKKKELLSTYKEGRTDKEEIYCNFKETIETLVTKDNIVICRNNDREADEVIAAIATKFNRTHRITIFSGDKDMLQLAYLPNITIANALKGGKVVKVTRDEILDKFKISKLEDVLKLRVFKGDASDKIKPPIPRFMKKHIDNVISLWVTNDLNENIFNYIIDNIKDEKVKAKLINAKDNIFLNYELMNLNNKAEHASILKNVKRLSKRIDK